MKFQKDIIFDINPEIYRKLKVCVQDASPNEAFGLILGPQPKEIILDNPGEFQSYSPDTSCLFLQTPKKPVHRPWQVVIQK